MLWTTCIFIVSFVVVGVISETEDERLDRLRESVPIEKRVLCNNIVAGSASSLQNAANSFAHAFGRRAVNPCLNQDACDYSQTFSGHSGISSGGLSGIIFGKRAEASQFIGKANRDIIFIIDDSGSIPRDQFEVAKQGAVTLSNSFCPHKLGSGLGEKQVAVVLFSSTPRTVISFEDSHKGSDWLASKIQSLPQARGGTATAAALKHVRKNLFNTSRLNDVNTSTHIIMVTDGQCNSGCQDLKEEADALRNMGPGVQLFALGVARARACELDIITGNGKDLAFGVSDFNMFADFTAALKEVSQESEQGCI